MSTDDGEPYTKKRLHKEMWPFHAIILDLPSYKRFLIENTLLLGLWFSSLKPNWHAYLKVNQLLIVIFYIKIIAN